MICLAQTTQAISAGMKSWTYTEWGLFFGVLGVFIGGPLTVFATMVFNRIEKIATIANSAKSDSAIAAVKADSAEQKGIRNTDRIIAIAKNQPSLGQSLQSALSHATPEAIRAAFARNAEDAVANEEQIEASTALDKGHGPTAP